MCVWEKMGVGCGIDNDLSVTFSYVVRPACATEGNEHYTYLWKHSILEPRRQGSNSKVPYNQRASLFRCVWWIGSRASQLSFANDDRVRQPMDKRSCAREAERNRFTCQWIVGHWRTRDFGGVKCGLVWCEMKNRKNKSRVAANPTSAI